MEKSTIAYSECPLCFDTFPSSNIAIHASSCTGNFINMSVCWIEDAFKWNKFEGEKKKPKAKGPVNVPSQESNPFLASRKRSDEERPAQTEPKKQKLEVSPSKVLKPGKQWKKFRGGGWEGGRAVKGDDTYSQSSWYNLPTPVKAVETHYKKVIVSLCLSSNQFFFSGVGKSPVLA